jgi:tRNA (guanine37-N1)-methyltransferase
MLKINILTLFPEYFVTPLESSIIGKAIKDKKIAINLINIRDHSLGKHQITDEPPYGGGAGMVMKIEPIDRALASLNLKKGDSNKKILLTSAKGKIFQQNLARELAQLEEITIICGHYEGVDERVADNLIDEEIRVGDYVLTGGEPAALIMIDAIFRLIPGVLGNAESLANESHGEPGQLAHPQYTRPEIYQDKQVPSVLLSGDHAKIEDWRKKQMTQAELSK